MGIAFELCLCVALLRKFTAVTASALIRTDNDETVIQGFPNQTGLTDEGFSLCAAMTMGDDQTGMLWGRRFGTQKIKRHDDAGFCLQGMILCCEAGDFFCPEKCMHTLAGNAAGQACDFRKPLAQCFFPDSVGFEGFSLKGEFPFPRIKQIKKVVQRRIIHVHSPFQHESVTGPMRPVGSIGIVMDNGSRKRCTSVLTTRISRTLVPGLRACPTEKQ